MTNSPSLTDLKNYMEAKYGNNTAGWAYSTQNRFHDLPNPIFATPINILDNPTDDLPKGRDAAFLQEFRRLIASAKSQIDIANLEDLNGEFRKELFWGIKDALASGPGPLLVRIVMGVPSGYPRKAPNPHRFLEDMKKAIGFDKSLSVYVALQNRSYPGRPLPPLTGTWNHAKYVAVDSKHVILGGHNWWGKPYLDQRPPFDLSIRVDGPAANAAHRNTDILFRLSAHRITELTSAHMIDGKIADGLGTMETHTTPVVTHPMGSTAVLAVAQNGGYFEPGNINPSLDAMHRAISMAHREINISQMSLASEGLPVLILPEFSFVETCGKVNCIVTWSPSDKIKRVYDVKLIEAIANALKHKAKINIYISNSANVGGYTNGDNASSIYRVIGHFLLKSLSRDRVIEVLRSQCQVKTVMTHGHIPWTKAPRESKSNHAKFWSADDLFYVGSHNMYPSVLVRATVLISGHLSEWGVIVEGKAESERIDKDYFRPLWNAGHQVAFDPHWLP